jgi:hypothetical protein
MIITVQLKTSPEGVQGLENGSQGEEFQIISSPNSTKVDIITPKGEKFTVCSQELIKAINCCSRAEPMVERPWWYATSIATNPTVNVPSVWSTGTQPSPEPIGHCSDWSCDGTCAVKTNNVPQETTGKFVQVDDKIVEI